MTQARAPLASDGDHEPSSKLPSLTRENYIRHIVFNRRMYIEPLTSQGQVRKSKPLVHVGVPLGNELRPTALRREPARLYS